MSFLSICLYSFGDLFKMIFTFVFLYSSLGYFLHAFGLRRYKNDLNRITNSFQIYFLYFISVLAMVFPWRQPIWLTKQKVKKSDSKLFFIL